ncbi:MAG: hypothetical protein WBG80_15020 [Bacteroidota bacterium]
MKKALFVVWGALLVALPLVTGCDQSATEPEQTAPVGVSNEEEAIRYFAANDDFVVNDEETLDDQSVEPLDYGTFGKIGADITPLRFGRFVTGIRKTVEVDFETGDTIAVAHVEKEVTGILKIQGINADGDTATYEKPFTDKFVRNIIFKRIARETRRYWLNWLPVASSLVEGGTVPTSNINITELTVTLPNGETIVITDPETYFLRYRWVRMFQNGESGAPQLDRSSGDVPEFNAGEPMKLQVKVESAGADPDVVVLRYGFGFGHKRRLRLEMVSEELNGGLYTRTYEISQSRPVFCHFHRGFFNMALVGMTEETLFDDVAPYAASIWGVPYRVL